MSSKALSVGNATAETVVSKSTQRKLIPDGDLDLEMSSSSKNHESTSTPTEASKSRAEHGNKRTINIAVLKESELLNMIKGYVNSMTVFTKNTRNVHKELKDTITNTGLVLNQYLRIKSPASIGE